MLERRRAGDEIRQHETLLSSLRQSPNAQLQRRWAGRTVYGQATCTPSRISRGLGPCAASRGTCLRMPSGSGKRLEVAAYKTGRVIRTRSESPLPARLTLHSLQPIVPYAGRTITIARLGQAFVRPYSSSSIFAFPAQRRHRGEMQSNAA